MPRMIPTVDNTEVFQTLETPVDEGEAVDDIGELREKLGNMCIESVCHEAGAD